VDAKAAKASALAVKAHAKALRPWYKKKRYWALGIVVLLVVIIVAAASGGGGGKPATSADGTTATTAAGISATTTTAAGNPGLGQAALDGDFAFTVHSVTCGITHIGTTTLGTTAPAGTQWCIAHMTVANDKDDSQEFFASNQKALDTAGHQLSADTKALVFGTSSSEVSTVNPGVSITVQVPFQLPSTAKITQLVLHDSAFSGGVTVNVG